MSRRVFRASRWCVWPAVLSLWFPGLSSAFAADYYVSPTGSDGNPGTFAAPFRTIQKARDVVKTVSAGMTSDIHVYLRGGWYVLASPLTFDPSCSGRNGHNIIYEAYPGEAPVISGGRRISGWALHDAGKNIWKAAAPGLETRQLFVNCVRAVRARKGTGNTSALPGAVKTATGFTTADTSMQSWGNITDVEFVFNGNQGGTATYDQHNGLWVEHRIGVAGINGTVITMKQPAWTTINGNTNHVLRVSVPTDIENAYELLDRPGEFYLNRSQGVLYYIPRSGQDMATAVAVAPVLESLVSGTGILGSPVRNLQFKGITFAHSTWLKPSGNDGFTEHQANACYPTDAFPAAGVAFKTAHEVRVERCVFAHLGGVGLRLYAGSRNCVVDACVFTDISGNGLMLGDVTDPTRSDTRARDIGNRVTNCYVHDSCVEYHGGVGIIALYVADTVIAHNEVAWLPYSGMSLGWGWGRASYMQGNHITANHVHHIMRRMCDGGCIYTLGNMPGSTIDNNWFDDMPTLFNAGAIYTDNGSENITACSNVCSAIGCRWLFVNTRKRVDIHHNYSTTTTQILRPETVAVVSDTTFMSSSSNNWPQAARDIASRAGIQSPHQDIKSLRCGCSAGFPVAPAAPADLTAAAISPYRVDLAWTDRSSNESGFRIDRRQSGTLSWAPVLETAANAAGWSDTSVLAGTKYYYTVLAYNAGGESPSGTVASATTPNGAPPPGCRFTAYNDLAWASGQLANRITTYTRGQAGRLVDNATGANTPVTLTVGTGGGGPYTDQGANAASGTDAYNVF
ncbi:MAG: hypothetical protein JXR37_16410, partial [Kiritimatiellae bacterium]|nr:hypothetical protein [Kiritimatiellia bacterium]